MVSPAEFVEIFVAGLGRRRPAEHRPGPQTNGTQDGSGEVLCGIQLAAHVSLQRRVQLSLTVIDVSPQMLRNYFENSADTI
jgi:hypothetical protein